jgi:ADP-dependent NAD(P)H-hydrate dehydratase / NAD(P)H-hydrate epimerase
MGKPEISSSGQIITAAQMRAVEHEAMRGGGITGRDLMETAGRAVVAALLAQWSDLAARAGRAWVLCGPGNNGGDGFVIARCLAEAGWRVDVAFLGSVDRLPRDARANHDRWAAMGAVSGLEGVDLGGADVIVDALFGIGLTRPLPEIAQQALRRADGPRDAQPHCAQPHCAQPRARVVAVDIPSGLCADSGRALGGVAVRADLTVAFHRAKPGHVLADGPGHCGTLAVVDIGIRGDGAGVPLIGAPARAVIDKADPMGQGLHKYDHGHALVVSGPMGRSGAARLAARAALRIGAGLVTVASPGSAMLENACQLTAIMLRRCDGADGLATMLAGDPRLGALCLGPGLGSALGPGQGTRDLVAVALRDGRRAVVLDADALSCFSERPETLFAMTHAQTVLTPHGGEFARLFPDLAARLVGIPDKGPAYSRIEAAGQAAARAGCVVILKGQDSVIAAPDGRVAVHAALGDRAVPWLATAGAGDVLAGMITGLMARHSDPWVASTAAVWLHVEAARAIGPGLIAEDIPDALPRLLRDQIIGQACP